jgi:hypothetical protein
MPGQFRPPILEQFVPIPEDLPGDPRLRRIEIASVPHGAAARTETMDSGNGGFSWGAFLSFTSPQTNDPEGARTFANGHFFYFCCDRNNR